MLISHLIISPVVLFWYKRRAMQYTSRLTSNELTTLSILPPPTWLRFHFSTDLHKDFSWCWFILQCLLYYRYASYDGAVLFWSVMLLLYSLWLSTGWCHRLLLSWRAEAWESHREGKSERISGMYWNSFRNISKRTHGTQVRSMYKINVLK